MIDLVGKVHLEIGLPVTGVFVLDSASAGVLDGNFLGLNQQTVNMFVLDSDELDEGTLGQIGDDQNTQWIDLLSTSQTVQIQRGAKLNNGPLPQLDLGTMVATVVGPGFDPMLNQLVKPGAPMRLIDEYGTVVFTGVVSRAQTSYGPREVPTVVTITSVDRVNQLQNINVTGGISQAFDARISALLEPNNIPFSTFDGSVTLAANQFSGNLLSHLELAVDSEQGFWYVGRDNGVYVYGKDYMVPSSGMLFSCDDSNPGFTSLTAVSDTQALFNDFVIKNLTQGTDGSGNPTSVETDSTYSNATSIATWGNQAATVTTNLASQSDVDALGAALVADYDAPAKTVQSLTFNAKDVMPEAAGLELFRTIHVHYENDYFVLDALYQIINITHDITPDRWLVTLGLIAA